MSKYMRKNNKSKRNSKSVIFAIYDSTTYRTLVPIAEKLKEDYSVSYLLLDRLLPRADSPSKEMQGSSLPRDKLNNTIDAMEYVNLDIIPKLNAKERPRPLHQVLLHRALEDNAPPQVLFDLDGFIRDFSPDLVVCGHDGISFVKQLIRRLDKTKTTSVVIQHGMNRPLLEFPPSIRGIPDVFAPSINPRSEWFEFLKRRFGYRYGAFPFGNPYIDEIYTMGDFFTNRISRIREDYPCTGKGSVQTVGSPEYNPSSFKRFNSSVDSAVFLSQWQYEGGQWNDEQQQWIGDLLSEIAEENNIELEIRPHPKETQEKLDEYFSSFDISSDQTLNQDVAEHDMVLTVDSTAILEGVLEGKVCGVLQPPWNENTFPPFTHDHIIQFSNNRKSIQTYRNTCTPETQEDYLNKYCYVPQINSESDFEAPRELITNLLISLLETDA